MKKIISVMLVALLLVATCLSFAACGSSKPTIAIIQFGSHASLNNCYDGILQGLEENGIVLEDYNVEHVISNFDPQLSQTQANSFVNARADVIIAIATPSAVAAATAADGDIPVVYCAVTDSTVMENYDNITGSSDIPDASAQLSLVQSFLGADVKIGVLYSTEESSSPIQVANLEKAAQAFNQLAGSSEGVEIISSAVSDITTIDAKVNELIGRGVDCFVNLLDNTIVGKLETNILPITNEKGIPVFGSEIEQVKLGCVASSSIEYLDVGYAAGKAAAEILGGKNASDIPVATITEPKSYYNSKVCAALGVTVPENTEATDVAE